MHILTIALTALIAFNGCSQPEPKPNPVQVIYETKKVYVTVPCKAPKVECVFSGDGHTPTVKLIECIINQKRALEYCSGDIEMGTPKLELSEMKIKEQE